MRQHLPHVGGGAELRPVAPHRCVEIDLATVGQQQRAHGHERLDHRVGLGQAVRLPAPAAIGTHRAAPQVHYPLAIPPRGGRGPGSRLPGKHLSENLAHRLEPRLHMPIDIHLASVPRVGVPAVLAAAWLLARGLTNAGRTARG